MADMAFVALQLACSEVQFEMSRPTAGDEGLANR